MASLSAVRAVPAWSRALFIGLTVAPRRRVFVRPDTLGADRGSVRHGVLDQVTQRHDVDGAHRSPPW